MSPGLKGVEDAMNLDMLRRIQRLIADSGIMKLTGARLPIRA